MFLILVSYFITVCEVQIVQCVQDVVFCHYLDERCVELIWGETSPLCYQLQMNF